MSNLTNESKGGLALDRVIFDWIYELKLFDSLLKRRGVNTSYINTKTIGLTGYVGYKLYHHFKDKIKLKKRNSISIDQDSKLYKPLLFYLIHKTDFFDHIADPREMDLKEDSDGDKVRSSRETEYYSLSEEIYRVQIPENYNRTIEYNGVNLNIHRTYEERTFNNGSVTIKFERINIKYKKEKSEQVVEFLQDAVKFYYREYLAKSDNISVYQSKPWGGWSEVTDKLSRPLGSVILERGLREEIVSDLEEFNRKRDFFNQKGIPYKRNYLFEGPPGTGKTSMIKALGTYFSKDIYFLVTSQNMDNSDFLGLVGGVPENSILVFEDVDSLFKGRESSEDSAVTFDTFINALDGVVSRQDIITIMTTNHVSDIDKTLLRSGRVDKQYYFGMLTEDMAEEMIYYLRGIGNFSKTDKKYLSRYVADNRKPSDLQAILLENGSKKEIFNVIKEQI